jgi:hypothetical protein
VITIEHAEGSYNVIDTDLGQDDNVLLCTEDKHAAQKYAELERTLARVCSERDNLRSTLYYIIANSSMITIEAAGVAAIEALRKLA